MASTIKTNNITGFSGGAGSAPITLSGDTATLGSGVTFPTGTITNYIAQTTTISSAQTLTTTYTTVTGSLISSYTPTTGASKVFYSVNLRISHADDGRQISMYIPFLDGSPLDVKKGFSLDTNTSATSFGDYVTYYTLLDTTGWTSGKDVELKARDYSTTYDAQLHRNTNFFDTSNSEAINLNDVNTIIYSIM